MEEIKKEIPPEVYEYCTQNCSNWETHIEKVPINELSEYSTAAGNFSNKPFTPTVIAFLKENSGRDFVIAEVYNDSEEMRREFKNPKTLINMAVNWKGNKKKRIDSTDKFSDMVNKNYGSLRPEEIFYDGWDTYESE